MRAHTLTHMHLRTLPHPQLQLQQLENQYAAKLRAERIQPTQVCVCVCVPVCVCVWVCVCV